ncbi:hypothetical protein Tco_0222609 [Tanacetum coccineum]
MWRRKWISRMKQWSVPIPWIYSCDETEVECDKKSMGNNEGSGSGNEKGESVSIGSRKSNKKEIKRTGGSLLTVMEELIKDQGNATDDILYKRMEIIKDIQEAEKVDNLEAAQKSDKMGDISLVSIEKVGRSYETYVCGILNTPFSFLGSKVGGCMSRTKSWDEVIDKMVNRLSKWKMKTLSIGGSSGVIFYWMPRSGIDIEQWFIFWTVWRSDMELSPSVDRWSWDLIWVGGIFQLLGAKGF